MLDDNEIPSRVIAFKTVPKRTKRHSSHGKAKTIKGKIPASSDIGVSDRPSIDKSVAIAEYARQMAWGWGDVELDIALVHKGYMDMCDANGWPLITLKGMSKELVDLGCVRKQLDLRKTGEGRPTVIVFPKGLKNAKGSPRKG